MSQPNRSVFYLNLKESYCVIIRKIITSKAAFVCEGMPVRFSNEANILEFLCIMFDHTGFFTLDRAGTIPFLQVIQMFFNRNLFKFLLTNQKTLESNQICFMVLCSHCTISRTCHWRYSHINSTIKISFLPSSHILPYLPFFYFLFQTLIFSYLWLQATARRQSWFLLFIQVFKFFKYFFISIFFATMNLDFIFSIEPHVF